MTTRPSAARPLRSEVARAVATLRSDPGLLGMKLRQRWQQRRQETAPSGAPRPKVASIDQDLAAVVAQVRERAVRTGVVYGDAGFRDALVAATPEVTWNWVSH